MTASANATTGPTVTRRRAVAGLASELEAAGVQAARVEAERLLARVLGVSRAELALSADAVLTPPEAGALARAAARRLSGEPLQHIEGSVEFRELTLRVDGRALIPRPETEQLVELVRLWAEERASRGFPPGQTGGGVRVVRRSPGEGSPGGGFAVARALDIGTGGGAIALSLVREKIAEHVVALDVSAEALALAEENRRLHRLEERVELRRVEMEVWSALQAEERFDLIVANPPYVSSGELPGLAPELSREPRVALDGGRDGLDVIREICTGVRQRLRERGGFFLEFGHGQGAAVLELLHSAGEWRLAEIRRDLTGRERFAVGLAGG